jgi:(S)-3,5-dihydroxyphenylglycine transaminase
MGITQRLLQYGPTGGLINDLIAQQLQVDEGIAATADRVLVTSGCQEAISLCLPALCPTLSDVLLVCNPTYIGATGAARNHRIPIEHIPNTGSALAAYIEDAAKRLHDRGYNIRALYLIPTFDNPTGYVLDIQQREEILTLCARLRIVILEDNPYGMFRFDGVPVPSMAELDHTGCVIYLSSFSKTLAPSLRVGAATLPLTLFGSRNAREELMRELLERKSLLTLNTSQLNQGIAGGILLQQNMSLRSWVEPARSFYHHNRNTMLNCLDREFNAMNKQIRWNKPEGGFFISMSLPFDFDSDTVTDCALRHGIIVMPMRFFALDESQNRDIRLSFSSVSPQQIQEGISSLAKYVESRLASEMPPQ